MLLTVFTIKLNKPVNLKETIEKLDEELKKEGGSLIGDTVIGEIESDGVKGRYIVNDIYIEVTIYESRYPRVLVEPYIRGVFKKISR
jgi:hypothetical protein